MEYAEQRALDKIDPLGREWERTAMICQMLLHLCRLSGSKLGNMTFMPAGTVTPEVDADEEAAKIDAVLTKMAGSVGKKG